MHWQEIASAQTQEPAVAAPPAQPEPGTETGFPPPDSPRFASAPPLPAPSPDRGCLDFLFQPGASPWTDVVFNGNGVMWGRARDSLEFQSMDRQRPSPDEVWQALESLLSPLGRACTEASPSVDAKIPRDAETGFAGARLKVLHPAIVPGDGFPAFAIRFFEQRPVSPRQIVEWEMAPQEPMDLLLSAVAEGRNILIAGGTGTGKTTLLAALCHGIPMHERIVKIEDPEEIWLPHPDVVTLEARPAPPGSPHIGYRVADGVDDAMRLAPSRIIVGEVRTGVAAMSLFRAFMSDHSGLVTFHANGPQEALSRLGVVLFADADVPFEAGRGLFLQAVDLVVHIGFQSGKRRVLGIHEVLPNRSDRRVRFQALYSYEAQAEEAGTA